MIFVLVFIVCLPVIALLFYHANSVDLRKQLGNARHFAEARQDIINTKNQELEALRKRLDDIESTKADDLRRLLNDWVKTERPKVFQEARADLVKEIHELRECLDKALTRAHD